MTTTIRWLSLVAFACAIPITTSVHAQTITDSFNTPPLNSSLVDADSAYSISGGSLHLTSSTGDTNRHYVSTVESDFLQQNFTYGLTFTIPSTGSTNINFFGIGQGVPDTALQNEPQNYIGLRIQSADTNGNIDLAINATGNANNNAGVVQQALGVINASNANDTDRAVLQSLNGQLTFMVDLGYTGVFTPTVSFTVPNAVTAAPFLNTSNTTLFFGTAGTQNQFNDFTVTPLPEPSSIVLLALGLAGLAFRSRRRHRLAPKA